MNLVIRLLTILTATIFVLVPVGSAHADDSSYRIEAQEENLRGITMSYRPVVEANLHPGYTRQVWRTRPMLFTIKDPHNALYRAYCLEITVSINRNSPISLTDWDGFLGDNAFGIDPQVRQKVAWIVQHSFPTRSIAELAQDLDIPHLSVPQAITATQSAIWRLTDGVEPDFADLDNRSSQSEDSAAITKLYNYLLSEHNTGLDHPNLDSEIRVEVPREVGLAGELIGPITIKTALPSVSVELPDARALVDVAGNEIDLDHVQPGQEMYLDLRNVADRGNLRIVVSAMVPQYDRSLITPLISPEEHGQSLVLIRHSQQRQETEAVLQWLGVDDVCRDEAGNPVRDGLTGNVIVAGSDQCVPSLPSVPEPDSAPPVPEPHPQTSDVVTHSAPAGEDVVPGQQLAKTGFEAWYLTGMALLLIGAGVFMLRWRSTFSA
ncbi:thioester domain-containing protein [Arcanobacterium pinnipediorum]|uniref:Thioester domain-containing protein n=1 Tax=Arcanobacterium pinnipediorum TaxID=1503041 RepID=A0ABY5AGE5_9ACTO|nr:thioester domain-containing protein [Arcanobacterium pinnipediorum]USR79264.1 thioester domain-containing protein [Arcanobacterium pinnipediorum]